MKALKIIVCVAHEEADRRRMIAKVAVDMGLALTPGDAAKLIKATPYDYDLPATYFVMAATFNFRQSLHTVNQLFRMAASGIAVIVGARKLQPEFEFLCQIINHSEI